MGREPIQASAPALLVIGPEVVIGDGGATNITLTHTGLPDDGAEHFALGWNDRYWGPLRSYLA